VIIDKATAKQILENEVEESRQFDMEDHPWVLAIRHFSSLCTNSKTMIAMLGTALLAKATEIGVDPFSLAVGDDRNSNTYSARNLCKEVLAAESNRLGIDLGVTGREPLNNQPFLGKARVSADLKVKSNAKPALDELIKLLTKLSTIRNSTEAREALRAFLYVQKKVRIRPRRLSNESQIGLQDFLKHIKKFVEADSEGGKRAQAISAGLLATIYGKDQILVSRVNDPSRNYPGDVGIKNESQVERSFEVRDKNVTIQDVHNFITKCREKNIFKCGVIAVSATQPDIQPESLIIWAESREVSLGLFFKWDDLVKETLFWSQTPNVSTSEAFQAISDYLVELEVSKEGFDNWFKI
jgi:hypothetical protein